jgi:hypothetical protein
MQALISQLSSPKACRPFTAASRPQGVSRRCVRVHASHVAYKELRAVAEKAAKAGAEVCYCAADCLFLLQSMGRQQQDTLADYAAVDTRSSL